MPNELYTPANLVGGLSSDSFAIDIDTRERAAAILSTIPKSDLYAPVPPPSKNFVDKNSSIQDLLVSNQDYLDAALKSDDAELFNLAWNVNNNRIAKDVQKTANLLPTGFVKEDWMGRYLDDDIGVDLTRSARENEQRFRDTYWNTKSWGGKALYGTTAFVSNITQGVISKTIASAGYLWELIEGGIRNIGDLATGRDDYNMFASMADNSLIRAMEHWDQNHKDSFLPMYKSINYDNKGFLSKLITGNFWTDEIADGLAFLGSVLIPGIGIAKGAQAITKGASLFSKASKFGRNANKTLEFFTGTDDVGGLATYFYNTGIESSIEAAEGFKSIKADLLKRNPGMTDEEATRQAGNQAKDIFLANAAILSASNMWEQRMIFSPLLKRAFKGHTADNISLRPGASKLKGHTQKGLNFEKKAPTNWFKSVYTDPYNAASFYGTRLIGGLAAEGFWEENAQLAATRWATGSYEKNDGTGAVEVEAEDNFFKQYFKQTVDAISGNDIETSTSIGLGGIIGSTSLAISRFRNYDVYDPVKGKNEKVKGELKAKIRQNELHADYINNAADDFLNSYNSVWEKNEKGEYIINTDVATKIREAQIKSAQNLLKIENVVDQIDKPEIQESLRRALLSKYLYALESIGNTDRFYKSLDLYSEQSKERLAELGLDKDNQKVAVGDIKNNLALFKDIRDKSFNTAFAVTQKSITVGEETITYTPTELEARKLRLTNTLYDLHSRKIIMQPIIEANEGVANDVKSSFQEGIREMYDRALRESADTATSSPENIEEVNNLIQTADRRLKHEELTAREQVIQDIAKESNINEEYKKTLQAELEQIKKEKKVLEDLGIDYSPTYKDEATGKEGDMMEDYRKLRYQVDSASMTVGYTDFLIGTLSDPINALQNLHQYEVFDSNVQMKAYKDATIDRLIAAYKADKTLPEGSTIEDFIAFLELHKDDLSAENLEFLEELRNERIATNPIPEKPEEDPENPVKIRTTSENRVESVINSLITQADNGSLKIPPVVLALLKSGVSLDKKVQKILAHKELLTEDELKDLEAYLPSAKTALDILFEGNLDFGNFTVQNFKDLLEAVKNKKTDLSAFEVIEGYEAVKNIVNHLVTEPNINIYNKAHDKIVEVLSEKGGVNQDPDADLKGDPIIVFNLTEILKVLDKTTLDNFYDVALSKEEDENLSRGEAIKAAWLTISSTEKEKAIIKALVARNKMTEKQAIILVNSWKANPATNRYLQTFLNNASASFRIPPHKQKLSEKEIAEKEYAFQQLQKMLDDRIAVFVTNGMPRSEAETAAYNELFTDKSTGDLNVDGQAYEYLKSELAQARSTSSQSQPQTPQESDIEIEKQSITPKEFDELLRLAKYFIENPKEPTTEGSVVTKYPRLFEELSKIEKKRQEELNWETKINNSKNKEELLKVIEDISNRTASDMSMGFNAVIPVINQLPDAKRIAIQDLKDIEKFFIKGINDKYNAELDALRPKQPVDNTQDTYGIEEAFALAQRAIADEKTFTEQRREEGIDLEDNEIDQAVDTGKENGNITLVTRKPSDIYSFTEERDRPFAHRRRMFLTHIQDGTLDKNNFKLLIVKEGKYFKAVVTNTKGDLVYVDDNGMPSTNKGNTVVFLIELDKTHHKNTLSLRRSQAFGRKNFKGPLALHESYKVYLDSGKSFIDDFTKEVKAGNIYASIDFITNGVIYEGQDKDTVNPERRDPEPKHSLKDLLKKGHAVNRLKYTITPGDVVSPFTINFPLKRDVSNSKSKTDFYQFRPTTIRNATFKGKPLLDTLPKYRTKAGKSVDFFKALSLGIIPSTEETVKRLFYLLVNPTDYSIVTIDGHYKIVSNAGLGNLMRKITANEEISAQDVLNLSDTDYKALLSKPLNVSRDYYISHYLEGGAVTMPLTLRDMLNISDISEYIDMVNENLKGSYEVFEEKGYTRINKRVIFTIDKSLTEMIRDKNKKEIIPVAESKEAIEVNIPSVESDTILETFDKILKIDDLSENVEIKEDQQKFSGILVNTHKEKDC